MTVNTITEPIVSRHQRWVSHLAVSLGAAGQFTVPVGCKLHGLVHVVLILLGSQHQLHIWVNAAVALVGVAPNHLLTVSTGGGGAGFAHWAGQGELQLTATSTPCCQHESAAHLGQCCSSARWYGP